VTHSTFDAPNLTVNLHADSRHLPISPAPSGAASLLPTDKSNVVCSIVNLNPNESHDFVIAVHPTSTVSRDVTAVAHEDGGGTASAFITSEISGVGLTECRSRLPRPIRESRDQLVYTVTVLNVQDDDARTSFTSSIAEKCYVRLCDQRIQSLPVDYMQDGSNVTRSQQNRHNHGAADCRRMDSGYRPCAFKHARRKRTQQQRASSIWVNP